MYCLIRCVCKVAKKGLLGLSCLTVHGTILPLLRIVSVLSVSTETFCKHDNTQAIDEANVLHFTVFCNVVKSMGNFNKLS